MVSRIWDFIIGILVAIFRIEKRLEAVERKIFPLSQEVGQLASEVKQLREELHPKDLAAIRWHVGTPRGER